MTEDEREDLAQVMASAYMPDLAHAIAEDDAAFVAQLLTPLTRQQLYALVVVLADQIPRPRSRRDDGVVDEVTLARVLAGESDHPLTRTERAEAVRRLAARGHSQTDIAARMRMSGARVRDLIATTATEEGTAA